MTAAQFALAVRADHEWVQIAAYDLGRRLRYTISEARWLGLVHLLSEHLGIPLRRAAGLAAVVLKLPPSTREVRLLESCDGAAAIVLDVARYHSSFAASLSVALTLSTPRRQGRMSRVLGHPVERAKKFGVDLDLVRASLALTPEERLRRLDANAEFLAALSAENQRRSASIARRAAARNPK